MDKDQQLLAHFFVRLFSLPVSVPDHGRTPVSEDGSMTQQPWAPAWEKAECTLQGMLGCLVSWAWPVEATSASHLEWWCRHDTRRQPLSHTELGLQLLALFLSLRGRRLLLVSHSPRQQRKAAHGALLICSA